MALWAVAIASSPPVLIVPGLFTGIGTRYASGRASRRGICGLSHSSARSLAATATFMAIGFLTVSLPVICWGFDMLILNALIAGLIFAMGPIVSCIANPAKVLRLLDIAGHWGPLLAFVMISAIAVGSVGCAIASRLNSVAAGVCPRPALVSAGSDEFKAMLFVITMFVGMKFSVAERRFTQTN